MARTMLALFSLFFDLGSENKNTHFLFFRKEHKPHLLVNIWGGLSPNTDEPQW